MNIKSFLTKIFDPGNNSKSGDAVLLIVRIGIAALMLTHGIPKLGKLFSGEQVMFPDVLGMGSNTSLALAVFAEFLCSIFILAGLGTRMAVIPLIITMLVAVFIIHFADPFSKKEIGLLFLLVYIFLLNAGSGKYSIDRLISDKINSEQSSQM